jgi:hypothetical protein
LTILGKSLAEADQIFFRIIFDVEQQIGRGRALIDHAAGDTLVDGTR